MNSDSDFDFEMFWGIRGCMNAEFKYNNSWRLKMPK